MPRITTELPFASKVESSKSKVARAKCAGLRLVFFAMALPVFMGLLPMLSVAAEPHTAQEYQVLQDREDRMVAVLPNRMIVIAQKMPAAPVVSAQVWVKTGSIYEQEHVGAGLSHFLEHLVSGGSTDSRTEEQSNALLGAIGGQTNAATSLDTVRYYINTTRDHTSKAIDLISDWLSSARITNEEYARERDVIQREFDMGRGDPNRIFWKLSQQARYPQAHPARHPTIGYIDEFRSITRDEIYDFYKRMYVPNNMVFSVAGDIEPRQVVQQIAGLWKDVPPGELPDLVLPDAAPQKTPQTVIGHADVTRPRIRLMWPNADLGTQDDYALDVLGIVLGEGESSRLVRELRDERQIVTNVDAYNFSVPWGQAFFGVDAEVADFEPDSSAADMTAQEAQLAQTQQAVLQQIEQIQQDGISGEELARAKRKVIAYVLQAAQTADGMAGRIARDVINHQDPDYLNRYAKAIEQVTAEQVQAAAEKYLSQDSLIVARLLPLEEGQQLDVQRRPDGEPIASGEAVRDIDLDNAAMLEGLKSHLHNDEVAASEVEPPQEFTLSNGIRLIVQRSSIVPAVAMQAYSLGGLLGDEAGHEGVSYAMASMLRRGTKSYSAEDLNVMVEDLGAELSTASGNNTWYVRARALEEDWPKVYRMMADIMLNPAFEQAEWEKLQPRLIAAIDRRESQWSGELGSRFREVFFQGHPWSQTPMGRREVIESLTAVDLADYHRSRLNGEDMVIAIVGDVDPRRARDLTEELFADVPRTSNAAFDPPSPPNPQTKVVVQHTDKPTTAVQIGFGPGIKRTSEEYPAVQVMSKVLSDFPVGYLHRALRGEGKGLVYAAWGYPRVGVVEGSYEIAFNTSPQDVTEAVQQVLLVVQRLKQGQISETDLQRAKAKLLTTELFGKQSNSDRAAEFALDELYGVDQSLEDYLQAVNAVTVEDVQRVAYNMLNNPTVVIISNDEIDTQPLELLLQ